MSHILILILATAGLAWTVQAEDRPSPIAYTDLINVIKSNLPAVSEEKLNSAVLNGLLDQLKPMILLEKKDAVEEKPKAGEIITQARRIDDLYAYMRVENVQGDLAGCIRSNYNALLSTNALKGLILDLRYAQGSDYKSAAEAADCFISGEQPLLTWDANTIKATTKTNVIRDPMAILVNHDTTGSAEILAAILRKENTGLVIGNNTSGKASMYKDIPLNNGYNLKVASTQVKLGNGTSVDVQGINPDIRVAVSSSDELKYFRDPYVVVTNPLALLLGRDDSTNKNATASSTNRPTRINEAELVRRQKEGRNEDDDLPLPAKDVEPAKPVIQDPSLARALDLLKALAVVNNPLRGN